MLSFSSYGWLTVIAFLDSSEDKNTHSWLPRHLQVRSVLQDSFGSAERSNEKPICINIVSKLPTRFGYQLIIFMTLASSYTVLAMGICAGGVSVHS